MDITCFEVWAILLLEDAVIFWCYLTYWKRSGQTLVKKVVWFFYLEIIGEAVFIGKIDKKNIISIYILITNFFIQKCTFFIKKLRSTILNLFSTAVVLVLEFYLAEWISPSQKSEAKKSWKTSNVNFRFHIQSLLGNSIFKFEARLQTSEIIYLRLFLLFQRASNQLDNIVGIFLTLDSTS